MLTEAISAHRPLELHPSFAHIPGLHGGAAATWTSLPVFDPSMPFQAFFAFTDGSFCPHSGHVAWAIVCVGLQDNCIVRVGCLGGLLAFPEAAATGAYAGEVEAILHARAALLASNAPVLHLGSDCSSALAASTGNQGCPEEVALLLDGATGLAYATAAQAISKSIARAGHTFGLHPAHGLLIEQAADKTLQWFWVLGDSPAQHAQYPFLGASGGWRAAAPTIPATMGLQPASGEPADCRLDLHILQYNCLSLKGHLAAQLMQAGLNRQGVHLAGFQNPVWSGQLTAEPPQVHFVRGGLRGIPEGFAMLTTGTRALDTPSRAKQGFRSPNLG